MPAFPSKPTTGTNSSGSGQSAPGTGNRPGAGSSGGYGAGGGSSGGGYGDQNKEEVKFKQPKDAVDAFIAANPGLKRTMIAVTCDKGKIQEARICLTKTLQPRPCSPEAARSCHLSGAEMDPVR